MELREVERVGNLDIDLEYMKKKRYNKKLNCTFLNSSVILEDLEDRVNKIIIGKQKKEIIEILNQLDITILDIHTDDDVVYFDTGLDRFIPVNVAGDGMKKFLSIITAIYNTKNGIVLIDEINNGLHYSAQEILWKAVITTAEKFKVQIFATTHSWECVKALAKTAQICVENNTIPDNEVCYFRVENNENSHTAFPYRQEILTLAMQENWEVR